MNKPLLRLSQVSFSYPDAPCLLKELDMTVEQGSFTVIIGESGSGKSTLSRIMAQVMPEHEGRLEGEVCLNAADNEHMRDDDHGHRNTSSSHTPLFHTPIVGYMGGELSSFIIGIVEDELAFGPANLGVDALEIESRIEMELKRIDMLDCRLNAVEQLSGGQQQQVAASSIWTMEPQLLIMDDAWSHLDHSAKQMFADALLHWLEASPSHTLVMILSRVEQRDQSHPLWLGARWLHLKQGKLYPTTPFAITSSISKHDVGGGEQETITYNNLNPQLQVPVVNLEHAKAGYRDSSFYIQADAMLMPGEAVLLHGENGSGKTTLLQLITKLLPLHHGAVSIDGHPLSKLKPHELARLIGYVPQSSYAMFLYDTVRQELEFAYESAIAIGRVLLVPQMITERACTNVGKVDVEEMADHKTNSKSINQDRLRTTWVQEQLNLLGLTHRAEEHPQELPAADRRMLNMFIATAHQPKLLILDEPTAGLDEASAYSLIQYCERLRQQGTALIVATHDELWDRFIQERSQWHVWTIHKGSLQFERQANVTGVEYN